ncbi:Trans-2,3-dihydro-3-hydroxyanthranilate isomerase [Pirellula sp. SH-Sr6A]|nr:Trans-2,3-dihydro-3-hydroxyanthranilate isomerase [Pirellula sp. SH-Sr6A]
MQAVAREMNLAETAFVASRANGFELRWFTPTTEVDLCGHATLASAFVLWHVGELTVNDPAHFHTRSGILTCRRQGSVVAMDFPATPIVPTAIVDSELQQTIERGLGCNAQFIGFNGTDYLVELSSYEQLQSLRPDFSSWKGIEARGFIVTTRCTEVGQLSGVDFVSRFFAPRVGVPEDPVTGSAHCTLGPYWGEKLGKGELRGYQASERGGHVTVRWNGDRVQLLGEAVLMSRVELFSHPY